MNMDNPPDSTRRVSALAVIRGNAPLVGEKLNPSRPPGLFSPIDPFVNCGLLNLDLARIEKQGLERNSAAGIVFKSILTRLLFNSRYVSGETIKLCGLRIDNVSTLDVLRWLADRKENDRARTVFFAHMHNLNTCVRNREIMALYRQADLVLPDGVALRIGAKLSRERFRENLSGTNLYPVLCRYAVENGVRIYLIGGKPGVAEKCAARTREQFSGLNIQALGDGYKNSYESIIGALQSNRDAGGIVLVGMGVKIQEMWIDRHKHALAGYDLFAVGGLFDYHGGEVRRAPTQWQSSGLEWLWRVKSEPRRLFIRYFGGIPAFLFYLVAWRWFQRP